MEMGAAGRPIVAPAFEPGAQARDHLGGEVTFWTRTAGDLVVPSGRIVACDPFEYADAPAFAREVLPGRYPVILALAQFARNGDERIVAAMLRLNDAEPMRWDPALWEREPADAASTTDEARAAPGGASMPDEYGVDSGFGAFMDEAAIEALLDHIEAEDDEGYLQRRLESLGLVGGPEWFDIPLDDETGANILLFTSGWGDGAYPSYWGYAADGSLVCLLTDFGVVNECEIH